MKLENLTYTNPYNYFRQYRNKMVPPSEYSIFLNKFSEMLDEKNRGNKYICDYTIGSLFRYVVLNLPYFLKNQAYHIYIRIRDLRRGSCLWSDKDYLKDYSYNLEKRFLEFSIEKKKACKYLIKKFNETKVGFFLNKNKKEIQDFICKFPNIYQYLIEPLYELSSKPLHVFFMEINFNMLFRLIKGQDIPIFNDIEKTLSILATKSNKEALKETSDEIFKSIKSISAFRTIVGGFVGEIIAAKNLIEEFGHQIAIKKIEGKGSCDYEFYMDKDFYLVESKWKSTGYGCEGSQSVINDFFINNIFFLNSFFKFVCPKFYQKHDVEMSHFRIYLGISYNQCINHIPHIEKYLTNKLYKKYMTRKEEIEVVSSIIWALYDQPIPIGLGNFIPSGQEQIENKLGLADHISRKKFCENLLKKGYSQLKLTEANKQKYAKKILHLYWPNYLSLFNDPLFDKQAGSISSARFRENLREILNGFEKGAEIELWISDRKSLYKLLGSNQMVI